ncbi:MAG: hypothetical protein GF329_08345 [Candidatus Lokiarchaeota archaeon]|nr:hypothetical protein [Candidatus Lokiarchaeota archaeon]
MKSFEDRGVGIEMKELKNWLETLHVGEIDMILLENALTHGSYKSIDLKADDYQRLEFLGDAVIDIIVSDKLYGIGKYSEGDLTELRSLMVKEKPLADLFDMMEMESLVRSFNISLTPGIKSDIVEAFFAVLYLEKGIKKCRQIWDLMMEKTGLEEKVIDNYLNKGKEDLDGLSPEEVEQIIDLRDFYDSLDIKTNQNARNVLEQLFNKIYSSPDRLPNFDEFDKKGPDHAPIFTVRLNESITIKGKTFNLRVKGRAGSLKRAQMKAAEKACDILHLSYNKI